MVFKSLLVLLLVTTSTAFEFIFKPGPLVPATQGEVWPKPQHQDGVDDGFYTLLPSFFQFKSIGSTCRTLEEALSRYENIIVFNSRRIKEVYYNVRDCYEGSDRNFLGYLTSLEVDLAGLCNDQEFPSLEMREDYELILTGGTRRLSSDSIWGILRGLESFSQLIYLTDDHSCHRIETTQIRDYPRFPHRGLLLDTARHYHPKETILRFLDAMSYNKFNVFHWHITDDYSFPYVSQAFPQLSEKGAFHPTLWVYDQAFIKEVQEYARLRGIRVLVEFDTPGHTLSWGLAIDNLLTKCYEVPERIWGAIDPTKESTYSFMFEFLGEVGRTFKDEYLHLGGDEVDFGCWRSNPEIIKFMKENDMEEDYAALQSYYTQKIIDYVTLLNRSSVVWEEAFTNGVALPKSALVQVWINQDPKATLSKVTAAGHRAILSAHWYLDQLATGGDWLKFYNEDPHDFPGTDEQKLLVMGGEACMWSEVVNENNLESRVWPRASVAAEKFWSARDSPKLEIAEIWPIASRLQEQTCRMNRRGIGAQPPTGPSVCF